MDRLEYEFEFHVKFLISFSLVRELTVFKDVLDKVNIIAWLSSDLDSIRLPEILSTLYVPARRPTLLCNWNFRFGGCMSID